MIGHVKVEWLLVVIILVAYFIYRWVSRYSTQTFQEDRDNDSSFTITSDVDENRVWKEDREAPVFSSKDIDSLESEDENNIQEDSEEKKEEDDLIILSIFAKPGHYFASYELLQAITGTGMQFGEMNMFHYYIFQGDRKITLFSLASMTQSGDFNLDRIGDYSCRGLTLFMKAKKVPHPEDAFSCMLEIAEQLADDLEGELRGGFHLPWSSQLYDQYQQKICSFQNAPMT